VQFSASALIGPYRLVESLGVVPRGKAYRAVDARSEIEVILKVIPASVIARVEEPEPGLSWQSMVAETRRLTRIDRFGIVALYEVIEDDDGVTLAFAPTEGETLRAHLASGSSIDRATLITWATRLLELLAETHAEEIVHRHIGEDSVRIGNDGHLHLADFGLTQLEFDRTPQAPPELSNNGIHSPASDVYQLAAVLHRLATQRLNGKESTPILAATDPLHGLFSKAMHEDPKQRHADAGEMLIALRAVIEDPAVFPAIESLPAVDTLELLAAVPQLKSPPPLSDHEFETSLTDIASLALPAPPPKTTQPDDPITADLSSVRDRAVGKPRRPLFYLTLAILTALVCGAFLARWMGRELSPSSGAPLLVSLAQPPTYASGEGARSQADSGAKSATPVVEPLADSADSNPAFVERRLNTARDLILASDDEGARYLLEELLNAPDLVDPLPVLDSLGSLYLRTDRPRKAATIFRRAIESEPNTERLFQLGLSQAALGDIHGALASLRQALELDPASENVQTVIAYLESGQ